MPAQKKIVTPDPEDGQLAAAALKPEEQKPKMMLEPEVTEPEVVVAEPVAETVQPIPATVGDLARVDATPVSSVESPQVEKTERGGVGWGWLWVVVAFAVGLALGGAGGYFMWGNGSMKFLGKTNDGVSSSSVVPTVEPTVVPTATPAANLNRSDLKIHVLNGSGVAGAASKAKDYLEGLGYVGVTSGNADTSDFAKTVISIKPAKTAFVVMLTKDLTDGKYIVDTKTTNLAADSSYDVIVTIGQ